MEPNSSAFKILTDSLENAPCGIGLFEISDGTPVFLNTHYYEMLGYTREEYADKHHSDSPSDILSEDQSQKELSRLEFLKTGSATGYEYRVYRKTGEVRWLQMNSSTIQLGEQNLAFVSFTDITKEKNIQIEAEQQSERFAKVADETGIAIFEWNHVTNQFSFSKVYQNYAISKFSPDDLFTSRAPLDFVHPEDHDKLFAFFHEIQNEQRKKADVTLRLKRMDDVYSWCHLMALLDRDPNGKPIRTVGVIEDINEEVESSFMMSNLINSIPGGIAVLRYGKHAFVDYFSEGFTRMSGYSEEENQIRLKQPDFFKTVIFEEDQAGYLATRNEAIREKKPIDYTFRMVRKDGSFIWLHMQAEMIRQTKEELIYYAVFQQPAKEAELFRRIVKDSSAGVFVADRKDRHILYINPTLGRLFHIPERNLIRDIEEATPLPDAFRILTDAQIATLQEDTYIELHHTFGANHLKIQARAISWNGIDAYMLFFQDETAEYQNRQRLEDLVNFIPTGIVVFEINGETVHPVMFNQGMYALLGMDAKAQQANSNLNIRDLIHPDDRNAFDAEMEKLRNQTDLYDLTVRVKTVIGSYVYLRLHGKVAERKADVVTVYSGVSNVDQQINEQKRLAYAERRQKELFDTIPSGILEFHFDQNGLQVISANRTLMEMIGYSEEEFAKVQDWDLHQVVHPEDYYKLVQASRSVEFGRGQTYDFRIYNRRSGEYRWISCDFTIIRRSASGIIVISAFQDIDDKRKAEQKSAATTQFLSRMSHDMRTPMNGILGIAELSKDETDPAILHENIAKIARSGDYLLGLINDTLDFQRIQSGKLKLEPEIVNNQEVIHDIIELIQPTAEKKGIQFITDLGPETSTMYVYADAMRLKQIFINLLSNAVKFTPTGGAVTFRVRELGRESECVHHLISVRDTGIGMSPEFLKNGIFKPFSQEYNAVTSQYAGSGLGLSIVKSLVELMGGHLEVTSTQGEGSRFDVYLDLQLVNESKAQQTKNESQLTQERISQQLEGSHILLAEDHPLNAEIATKLLQKKGCEVTWKENGQLCVEAFRQSPVGTYDAILMDIRMPVMDGYEATRAIRNLTRADAKSIPILAMTANAFDTDVKEAERCGMNAHLSKPIEPERLYETLAEKLQKKGV